MELGDLPAPRALKVGGCVWDFMPARAPPPSVGNVLPPAWRMTLTAAAAAALAQLGYVQRQMEMADFRKSAMMCFFAVVVAFCSCQERTTAAVSLACVALLLQLPTHSNFGAYVWGNCSTCREPSSNDIHDISGAGVKTSIAGSRYVNRPLCGWLSAHSSHVEVCGPEPCGKKVTQARLHSFTPECDQWLGFSHPGDSGCIALCESASTTL